MDFSFLSNYYIPLVVAACLVIGCCIKQIDVIPNKFIPTILAAIGAVVAVWDAQALSATIVINGALSGLIATGLYEAFTQYLKKVEIVFDDETDDVRDDIEIKESDVSEEEK